MVKRKRSLYSDVWPIDPESARLPEKWTGWPDGKKFALVLTHDVDTQRGHDSCHLLAEMESRLGFRSSFNFVAEDLRISTKLTNDLRNEGFEVGLHGIYHKNPFKSKKYFQKITPKINHYLKAWNAVGFRSPSMYHNLSWIHDLDIKYDSSTFDTDPFEPQPDGVGTIFPFWVTGYNEKRDYVELPYTLPQDFLLFILMQCHDINIWKQKLDWIVEKGGMALFITHPDYMNFNEKAHYEQYTAIYYEEFLTYIKSKYEGQYWQALPKEVAKYWADNFRSHSMVSNNEKKDERKKIWIDLDNTPHIPFFKPIIEELRNRGYETVLTARDAYQVVDMADRFGLKYTRVGRHFGKNKLLKVLGTLLRSFQMAAIVKKEKPILAISHGSRSQLVAARMLGIPAIILYDYEYAKALSLIRPSYIMVPEIIPDSSLHHPPERVYKYPGIKEDVYVPTHVPSPVVRTEIGIDDNAIIVTIRPPATEAHYFNPLSEELFEYAMMYLLGKPQTQLVVLPRNKSQEEFIRRTWSDGFKTSRIIIPEHAVDGLDLMWFSDLVISGGGTMNREAAALGVPVYSIFRGKIGAVDNYLAENGRLILIESAEDFRNKVVLEKRPKERAINTEKADAFSFIIDRIIHTIEKC